MAQSKRNNDYKIKGVNRKQKQDRKKQTKKKRNNE